MLRGSVLCTPNKTWFSFRQSFQTSRGQSLLKVWGLEQLKSSEQRIIKNPQGSTRWYQMRSKQWPPNLPSISLLPERWLPCLFPICVALTLSPKLIIDYNMELMFRILVLCFLWLIEKIGFDVSLREKTPNFMWFFLCVWQGGGPRMVVFPCSVSLYRRKTSHPERRTRTYFPAQGVHRKLCPFAQRSTPQRGSVSWGQPLTRGAHCMVLWCIQRWPSLAPWPQVAHSLAEEKWCLGQDAATTSHFPGGT